MIRRAAVRATSLRLFALAAAAVGVASGVSCGGAPAAPQAPASSAGPLAMPKTAPAADVSAVPDPKGLVVSGRLARLSQSFATVHGWTTLPVPQSDEVTELLAGEKLGPLVDLDQPVDFAVGVSGGAHLSATVAVSAGLRDPDAAKATLGEHYKLTPGPNGVLAIEGLGKPKGHHGKGKKDEDEDEDDDDSGHPCELAPAYGASPTRIVCGLDTKSLAELGPWLTRTAVRAQSVADFHVDVRMAPLRPIIVEQKRMFSLLVGSLAGGLGAGKSSEGAATRAFVQAIVGDLGDWATDLDSLSSDIALADAGAAWTTTMRYATTTATMTRLAIANADKDGPAPATFWQMPGDSDVAGFWRGLPEGDLASARGVMDKMLVEVMNEAGLKEADRTAVVGAIDKLWITAPMTSGSGIDADAARKALAAVKAAGDGDTPARREAVRVANQALLGWHVIEIDGPADVALGPANALAAALARPGVAAAIRAKGGSTAGSLRAAPMPKGVTLPKDARHFVAGLAPGQSLFGLLQHTGPIGLGLPKAAGPAPAAPKPVSIDIFVVPDGARTWVGLGGDPALVASRVTQAMSGTGDGLRTKPELNGFKDGSVGAAGYFSGRGLAAMLGLASTMAGADDDFDDAQGILEETAKLPHGGTTPIPYSFTSVAGAPQPTTTMTLQVPRGVIEDAVITVANHGGF